MLPQTHSLRTRREVPRPHASLWPDRYGRDEVVRSVFIDKAEVLEVLRARELHGRADWLDREMPAFIDIIANASLLRTLGIDVEAMRARDTRDNDGESPTRIATGGTSEHSEEVERG